MNIEVNVQLSRDCKRAVYDLPIRIESVANKREHWGKRAARTKLHRFAAIAICAHRLPCVVTLIRIAPRKLDGDNLQSGFKALRDGVAKRLGVDDADPRVEWKYDQQRGKAKEYAARVVIESRDTHDRVKDALANIMGGRW